MYYLIIKQLVGSHQTVFRQSYSLSSLLNWKAFQSCLISFFPKFCWLRPNYAEQHLSNEKIADIWLWVCRLVHKQRTNWWEVCLRLLRGLGPIMVPHTSINVTSHMEHNVAESIRGSFCHKNGSYKTLFLLILWKITKIWIQRKFSMSKIILT